MGKMRTTIVCSGGLSLYLWFTSKGENILAQAKCVDQTMLEVHELWQNMHPTHNITQKMTHFCSSTHFLRVFDAETVRTMTIIDFVHLVKDQCAQVAYDLKQVAESLQDQCINTNLAQQFVNLGVMNLTLLRELFMGVYCLLPDQNRASALHLTRNLHETLLIIKSF